MRKSSPWVFFVVIGLVTLALTTIGGASAAPVGTIRNIPLHNGGFRRPPSNGHANQAPSRWVYFGNVAQSKSSVHVTKQAAHSDHQSLMFTANKSNAIEGYWQGIDAQYNTAEVVSFSVYFKSDHHSPLKGTAQANVGVEFHLPKGEGYKVLNERYLAIKPSELSTTRWKKFTVTVAPTRDVVGGSFHFVISMADGASPGGAFYVDDASAKVR